MRISIYIRTTGANKLYKSILFACLQEPDDLDLQELKRVIEVNLKRNGITQERIQAIQDTVKLIYDSQSLRNKLKSDL
jgi:acyl-[acyl carrier protein]--UDP-N-acetylglucosamine O-acyltransferase